MTKTTAPAALPQLSNAQAPLTRSVEVINEFGARSEVSIPAERDLTVYVDKRELVTLMTLGAHPEWLVLGYLLNQRLVGGVHEIESITVDWDVGAAAVVTRSGIDRIEERTARRVVTTGCGQGSVFGGLMDDVDRIVLPPQARLRQSQLYSIVNTIRLHDSTYKTAGSVHACALFVGDRLHFPDCVLRVTAPREPCYKFNAVMGFAQAGRAMALAGHCGYYLAVDEPGTIAAGQTAWLQPAAACRVLNDAEVGPVTIGSTP